MMAFPSRASNQKCPACLAKRPTTRAIFRSMSILSASLLISAFLAPNGRGQNEPPETDDHQFEELGINRYTAPSIARIFQQLDELKPLPFDQVKRDLPQPIAASREQKALIFGGLIADGFLLVANEKRNLIENFGRVLLQHARALGVGERVTRHSASLIECGRRGDWVRMRSELIQSQIAVEQAMVELRDEKIAHLISLGGWLRGLEICATAVASNFSHERAKVLAQPDLADYFAEELKTLPPALAQKPLFEKLGDGTGALKSTLKKSADAMSADDVRAIESQARELNSAIRTSQ
jgi:hypothetical protein